jgi:hypothetical protein
MLSRVTSEKSLSSHDTLIIDQQGKHTAQVNLALRAQTGGEMASASEITGAMHGSVRRLR